MAILAQTFRYEMRDNGLGRMVWVRLETFWLLGIIPVYERAIHVHGLVDTHRKGG